MRLTRLFLTAAVTSGIAVSGCETLDTSLGLQSNASDTPSQTSGVGGVSGASTDVAYGIAACNLSKQVSEEDIGLRRFDPNSALLVSLEQNETIRIIIGTGKDRFNELIGNQKSPFCYVEDPRQAIVMSVKFYDEGAIAAAEAVDTAQEALGLKRTLYSELQRLKQQSEGSYSKEWLAERELLSKNTANAALRAAAELKLRVERGELTPEIETAALALEQDIGRASYFTLQGSVGIKTVKDIMDKQSGTANLMVFTNEEEGIDSAFVQEAIDAVPTGINNLVKVSQVRLALSGVNDRDFAKRIEQAEKRGRKDAQKRGQQIFAETEPKTF